MPPVETRNPPAFDSVYHEFLPRIQRYLQRLVGPNDAEDVTQDVFVKVSQGLQRFRGDSSLSTRIYRIATNAAYDRLRSRSFQRAGEAAIDDEVPLADRSPGAEPTLVRKEMSECGSHMLPEQMDAVQFGGERLVLRRLPVPRPGRSEALMRTAAAKKLGIRSLPAVVVNGKLANCCAGRGPDEHVIREALR